jgi:hypothetical protein
MFLALTKKGCTDAQNSASAKFVCAFLRVRFQPASIYFAPKIFRAIAIDAIITCQPTPQPQITAASFQSKNERLVA